MEQHILSVRECKNKLQEFSDHFQNVSIFLDHQCQWITNQAENFSNVKLGSAYSSPVSDEALYSTADNIASEILRAKCLIESSFENYHRNVEQHPFANDQEEPRFLQWLHKISSLQQLLSKQKLFSSSVEQDRIELSEIQLHIEIALAHLNTVNSVLNYVHGILKSAKDKAIDILLAENFKNLYNLCWVEFSQFSLMEQTISECQLNICRKYTLMIDEQPRSVIMKMADKKPQCGAKGSKVTTTRTDISVKLVNFFGQMNFPNMNSIPIKIGLINESEAHKIPKSNFSKPMEYQAEIYSCVESTGNAPQVLNFDKFITTNMQLTQLEQTGTANANSRIYEARIPNISVIKVGTGSGRHRKGSGLVEVPVIKDKFYFLITTELPFLQWGAPVTAWTISIPVIIRTHSTHTEGALATTSWSTYFSENTQIPFNLKTDASIAEIRDVLQLHFKEWTSYTTTNGNQASLTLEEFHLQFLIDMLLEHICSHLDCKKEELASIPLEFFYYEKLIDRKFSFWSWFHKAVSILKREYIRDLWNQGYIKGFIGKIEAYNLLNENGMKFGNFLIRFSQSVEEELCIMFVSNNKTALIHPLNIDKTTDQTFKRTFLEHIYKKSWSGIQMQEAFLNVYPNTPKETAFPRKGNLNSSDQRRAGPARGPPYVHEVKIIM